MTASAPSLDQLVTFVQHALPGFEDGTYRLTVAQQILDGAGAPVSGDAITEQYSFAVAGDRFRLSNPAASLYAVFPADGATGQFATVLPHAIFSAPTLPWSRSPSPDGRPAPPPGADTDTDVPTWLGILVLDDSDAAAFPGLSVSAADATIGDLLPPTLHPASTLGTSVSYFTGATDPSVLEAGNDPATPIRVIDLPLGLFWQIAPSMADLTLLAHVRRVDLTNKPTIPLVSDQGMSVGDFAVVVGNRLPADGVISTAHLVSLEGMEHLLPTDDGARPATVSQPPSASIRLAVLKSWSFTATGQPATFVDTLLALNAGRHGAEHTALRFPATSSDPVVATALAGGYVALDHNLRDRGTTVSWYRGPLAPVAVGADRVRPPVSSADQAVMFDPTTGMFDASYAAAWTVGRMLALQDAAFAGALYRWKIGLTQQVVDAVEAQVLHDGLGRPGSTASMTQVVPHVLTAVLGGNTGGNTS